MAEIKTVIFDIGDVLLYFDAPKACKRFSKAGKVSFLKLWKHFFTDPTEKAYTRGEITSKAFYRHACKALQFDMPYADFKHYWNDIFWENESILPVILKLKEKYPLYVISNTNDLHYEHIRKKYKVFKHFKRLFPSHKVGARKPEPAVYRRVLEKIKYHPSETLFIDDKIKFVKGARAVGMHSVRYRGTPQLIKDLKKFGIEI
ncbi:MAG: HAD family phosphatase [Candidatus Omnitrophica bacterium]|nr:HAD family phosphatase [Candidatus Omnitrophota bacterium]